MKVGTGDTIQINGERVKVIGRRLDHSACNGVPCLCLVVENEAGEQFEYWIPVAV